jgi:hypothetical protein
MTRFVTVLFGFILLASCVARPMDVSTGTDTAVIKRIYKGITDCRIFPGSVPFSTSPTGPTELTIDAERTTVVARCPGQSLFGGGGWFWNPYTFVAVAGHVYEFRRHRVGPNCLALVDTTAGDNLIACEPYYRGGYANYSTGEDPAVIQVASDRKSELCSLEVANKSLHAFRTIEVDAGPTTIDATCNFQTSGLFQGTFMGRSRFEFVAEAAHRYSVAEVEKDCITLHDVTSEKVMIACEAIQEIE